MASAREKIPQLGLWDDEVPKLSHDSLVLWAYNNAEKLVRAYLAAFPDRDFYNALSDKWGGITNHSKITLADLPPMPEKPAQFVVKKTLEPVIEQYPEMGNGRSLPRILGYADLVITWYAPQLEWGDDQQWHVTGRGQRLLVEAKTVMPSVGELMRQLNLYRLVYSDVVVLTPDSTHAQLLLEQGVLLFPYVAEQSG